MPIRKHPKSGIYFLDIRPPSGPRIRRSCGTKDRKEAQEYHDKLKHELWRVEKLGEQASRTYEEAALKYLKQEAGKKDYDGKERHLLWFGLAFAGRAIHTLGGDEIIEALPTHDQRNAGKVRKNPPGELSNATRNRYSRPFVPC
jgi:hypothetical protein